MGYILSLKRNGLQDDGVYGVVDDLTYTYNGNQVVKVDDAVDGPYYKDAFHFVDGANEETEYEYDGNGNMIKDLNKKISQIEYNCLNLPQRISYQDGSRVLYTYDAGGVKLRTDYYINPLASSVPQVAGGSGPAGTTLKHTWTDYCGNFIYENDSLKQTLFPGGYVSYRAPVDSLTEMMDSVTAYTANVPVYNFYIKDHLGNDRVVVDEKGNIEQINHYYPFGGLMGESRNLTSNQKYKYNGKELDRMHGLDWYDYGARNYDGMRFTTMDPLAEKYYSISPYVYCHDNPLKYIDPNGKDNVEFFPPYNTNEHDNLSLIDYAIQSPWVAGRVDLFAHGSPSSICFTEIKGPSVMLKNIDDIEKYSNAETSNIIVKLDKNNELTTDGLKAVDNALNQSKEWKDGAKSIVLHSCYTGAESLTAEEYSKLSGTFQREGIQLSTNIAKELSKNYKDVSIIAPSGSLSPSYDLLGNINGTKIGGDNGHWNVYLNGKKVETLQPDEIWNSNTK